jgi:4-oxalocrotonate tautomerase
MLSPTRPFVKELAMPYLNLKHSATPDEERDARIAAQLTRLTASHLGKLAEVTALTIEGGHRAWFIAGRPVAASGLTAFQLQILITEGTNRADEVAAWIDACHALLVRELAPCAEASYIVVEQVPAEFWGYGGKTQAERRRQRLAL